MFEDDLPKHKIGCLSPLAVVENAAYEFYRLAPPGLMLVLIPVGLAEFSRADVERVFAPLDSYLDMLMERDVNLVMQNGVPLPLLIGIEAHDRMIDHMAKYSGVPATSTVLSVGRAARPTDSTVEVAGTPEYFAMWAIIRSWASRPISSGSGTPFCITRLTSRSRSMSR